MCVYTSQIEARAVSDIQGITIFCRAQGDFFAISISLRLQGWESL